MGGGAPRPPSRGHPPLAQVQGSRLRLTLRRPTAWPLLLVGAITALGLALRLDSFDDALFGDELSTYYIVTGHRLGEIVDRLQGNSVDLNPPLLFVLDWAAVKLGNSPEALRLPSLIAGTAAIPLTYLLGLWTVGRCAALVGAALMALSPFLIFYSTEARAYALVLCLVLVSTLTLVRALDRGRLGWWVAYAASSCAAMYAHYPAVFVLVAQFVWAFAAHPEARRALLAANVAAAVGYLPWLPTLLDNTDSPGAKVIEFIEPFDLEAVRVDIGRWTVGHPHIPLDSMPGGVALALLGAGLLAAVVGLALRLHRAGSLPRPSAGVVLVLVLALAAPVEIALYSAVGDSVWISRNLGVSWPGLALAAGALVTGGEGVLRAAAVVLVVGAFAIGGVRMLDSDFQRPDYEAAARFIEGAASAEAPVVEVPVPSPGPLTPLGDVPLNRFGQEAPGRHEVLRLGVAPLSAALRARPYQNPPAPAPQAIAAQAGDAARGGTLFLGAPGSAPLARLTGPEGPTAEAIGIEPAFGTGSQALLMTAALSPLPRFLAALPARFRHVETRTFPGFMPLSVYVFQTLRTGG